MNLQSLHGPKVEAEAPIAVGTRWTACHARGRADAMVFTVRGITAAGIYITSFKGRSPGHLIGRGDFRKLYDPAPELAS